MTKDYASVDGENIYFDESFEEEPDKANFEEWLQRIEGLLETLLRSNPYPRWSASLSRI